MRLLQFLAIEISATNNLLTNGSMMELRPGWTRWRLPLCICGMKNEGYRIMDIQACKEHNDHYRTILADLQAQAVPAEAKGAPLEQDRTIENGFLSFSSVYVDECRERSGYERYPE